MSWYRTYRPRRIADLHLTKVRETFSRLLEQGKLSQVMLFAGPKGTGKTTTARIVAALVNDPQNYPVIEHLFFAKPQPKKVSLGEPDEKNELLSSIFEGKSFLVQELDAASNRGIDDIRLIKERINIPPQTGLMTVYILDEAHMLTTEAFNALLKVLEEPPPHVMFILATTELHKIPDTIKSRATTIEFTKATAAEISDALTKVLSSEKKTFDPAAVSAIAAAADGSFRDAVKLAETLSSTAAELTLDAVAQQLSLSLSSHIQKLLEAVLAKQPSEVVSIFEALRQSNVDQNFFFKQLLMTLHTHLLQHLKIKEGTPLGSQPAILFLLQELGSIPVPLTAPIPFLLVEVKLLDLIYRSQDKNKKAPASSPPSSSGGTTVAKKATTVVTTTVQAAPESVPTASLVVSEMEEEPKPTLADTLSIPATAEVVSDNLMAVGDGDSQKLLMQWDAFVDLVRNKNSSLAALLRSAKPLTADKGKATIAVFYKFHKEQLQQPRFQQMIDQCVEPLTGGRVKLEFVVQDSVATTESATVTITAPSDTVTTPQTGNTLVALAEELLV